MAVPNRIIREAILSSEKMALLDWPAEVFYRRLMSVVDDYGRCESNPQLLRSRCYPLQTDTVRVADITRWMAACQTAGLILIYAVQDKRYLEVINFQQQQRSPSKCPQPPAGESKCQQLIADAHLDVDVVVVGDDTGKQRKKRAVALPLPDDFCISESVRRWYIAKNYPPGLLDDHLESFVSYAKRNGKKYADWDQALMGAIREDWGKVRALSGSKKSDEVVYT